MSDMAKQVGKLAKAVEGLCGALGPAVRDGIKNTLGPQVQAVHAVAAEVRSAVDDMNQTAAALRQGGTVTSPTAGGKLDANSLATALVPKIEAVVLRAFEGKQLVANAAAAAASYRGGGGGGGGSSYPQKQAPPQQQAPSHQHRMSTPDGRASPSAGGMASKGSMPHQIRQKQHEDEGRAQQQEAKQRQVHNDHHQQQQYKGGGGSSGVRPPVKLSDDEVKKIHSAIRWNKPLGELAALIAGVDQANCVDSKNGNRPLHIAAQNGYLQICKLLMAKGADINAVNFKKNTALHMALGYDYDDTATFLYSSGADGTIVNSEGHAAKNGLEGDKGPDGYVPPVSELREARTVEESLAAIRRIGTEGLGTGDKAQLAQVGLIKKKNFPESWTPPVQVAFRELMMSLPRT